MAAQDGEIFALLCDHALKPNNAGRLRLAGQISPLLDRAQKMPTVKFFDERCSAAIRLAGQQVRPVSGFCVRLPLFELGVV